VTYFFFDFSAKSEDGKRVVLLFYAITKNGERILFREGDKIFLGTFSNKNDAKLFALQVIFILESVLGVRMDLPAKEIKMNLSSAKEVKMDLSSAKEKVIVAVIS